MDELVDVVDEHDAIIGQEWKSVCHQNHILHRSVNILIFKDQSRSELLLQKRGEGKHVPGRLCIPGGHLTPGETYAAGAQREFLEEQFGTSTGKAPLEFEELFKIRKTADNDHEFTTVFRTIAGGPFSPSDEVESCFFEGIRCVLERSMREPEKFTETTVVLLQEYAKRFP